MSFLRPQFVDESRWKNRLYIIDLLLNYNYFHTDGGAVMRKWNLFLQCLPYHLASSHRNAGLATAMSHSGQSWVCFYDHKFDHFLPTARVYRWTFFLFWSRWTLYRVSHDTFMCVHIGKVFTYCCCCWMLAEPGRKQTLTSIFRHSNFAALFISPKLFPLPEHREWHSFPCLPSFRSSKDWAQTLFLCEEWLPIPRTSVAVKRWASTAARSTNCFQFRQKSDVCLEGDIVLLCFVIS